MEVFARVSLLAFWIVMLALGIVAARRQVGEGRSFGVRPSHIPKWGYILIPAALLGFLYLSALTVLYIWDPSIGLDFVWPRILVGGVLQDLRNLVGGVLTLVGTVIFVTAFFNLGSSVRLLIPDEREKTSLVTDGWYALSRNPLYLGLHVAMIGWVVILPGLTTIAALIIFLANQHFRILMEERFLEERFDDEYRTYRMRVRRYL